MAAIETERLRLRPATPDDLAAFHTILGDRRAMPYWSTPPHDTVETTRAWLDSMIDIPPSEGEDFVVERNGRAIGKAGFYRFPEIGFILHPDAWGRGFAGEAVHAVLDRAFRIHRLDAVIADVDPRNAACLALLARLGFLETGRRARSWLVGDRWCDSIDLRLARRDWAMRAA